MRSAKPWWLAAALLLAALLALSACGGPASNEVDMGVATFKQATVTISAGQAVHFVDPGYGGGVHVLCVGMNLECVPQADAPAELNTKDGLTFNTGDTRDIVFATPGTYEIICTIHPGMVVSVIVH